MPLSPVLVSAHARSNTIEHFERALASGAEYVEVDIRRTADGELVAVHDPGVVASVGYGQLCDLAGHAVPRVADVLTLIKGRAKGHLDLKVTGGEDDVVRLALDVVGPGEFVVTTLEDASVATIRSRFGDPEAVPVALTLGRGMRGASAATWLRTRASELRPMPRVRACGASWVAVDHRLALAGVARECRRHRLNVMVWTVNGDRELRYWLASGQADVLITDRPARAIAFRAGQQQTRQ